jgi:hypothetical protein
MNIVELGQGELSWRLPADLVSGVGTLIVIVLILLGMVVWKLIYIFGRGFSMRDGKVGISVSLRVFGATLGGAFRKCFVGKFWSG